MCSNITIAGQALQRENVARGGGWDDLGCNWRRAKVGDQSMDGLSVKNPADGRYYFEDVIGSAGSADAFIKYRHPFREDALLREVPDGPYAPQGYADPRALKTHFPYDAVIDPPPPAVCKFDLAHVEVALDKMRGAILALASEVSTTKTGAFAAQAAAEEARDEVRTLLEKEHPAPPVYTSNRLPVIGTITLKPQP